MVALEPSETVTKLLRLNAALSDRSVHNLGLIRALLDSLDAHASDDWVHTGVVDFARRTCRVRLAKELRGEAAELVLSQRPEDAIALLEAALALSLADARDTRLDLISLRSFAENELRFAPVLRTIREALQSGHLDTAKKLLEQVRESWSYRDLVADLERLKVESDGREAARLYQLGEGEQVLALLKDATDPSLVAFREKVECVHRIYTEGKERYESERWNQGNDPFLWETLKRVVGDPTNQYYKWADAGIKVDPVQLAAEYAKEARETFTRRKFLEAAKLNTLALKYDAKNADALKLRATIERQVNLHYVIERQWSDRFDVAFAIEQYRILRAASPSHPMLATLAGHIRKAGGDVPSEDNDEDPNK